MIRLPCGSLSEDADIALSIAPQHLSRPLAENPCITPPPELQFNQPETQNTSRPGMVIFTTSGQEAFLATYSATVGQGVHGGLVTESSKEHIDRAETAINVQKML